MIGNTLSNVSKLVANHDAANKAYVNENVSEVSKRTFQRKLHYSVCSSKFNTSWKYDTKHFDGYSRYI